MKIGITGGIGSGKSTVAHMMCDKGAILYNSDQKAKEILQNDVDCIHRIKDVFGTKAYINGVYNATFIASIVFNNQFLLNTLNSIIHPKVIQDFNLFCLENKDKIIVYESALIVETGHWNLFDIILLVTAPIELKIKRLLIRNKLSREELLKRIEKQSSDEIKAKYATYIIQNIEQVETQMQVNSIWSDIQSKK